MSSYTGVVTARDLLGWAIDQGVFTEKSAQQQELHEPVTGGIAGPWTDIVRALVTAAGEGLVDHTSGIARNGRLDGFEEYVEESCLANVVRAFSLSVDQASAVMRLAEDVRLFFDGTISISPRGLDAPLEGELRYHCGYDYKIEIPDWAAPRAI